MCYDKEFIEKYEEIKNTVENALKNQYYNVYVTNAYFSVIYIVLHHIVKKYKPEINGKNKTINIKSLFDKCGKIQIRGTHELYLKCFSSLIEDNVLINNIKQMKQARTVASYSLKHIDKNKAEQIQNIYENTINKLKEIKVL